LFRKSELLVSALFAETGHGNKVRRSIIIGLVHAWTGRQACVLNKSLRDACEANTAKILEKFLFC
jgi:hypothetical protein